jgi:hypothetical protein
MLLIVEEEVLLSTVGSMGQPERVGEEAPTRDRLRRQSAD